MTTTSYIEHTSGGTAFVGPDAVAVYRSVVIESALRFYAKTGMKVNRAYTPTAMLKTAEAILKRATPFKRGQFVIAADELRAARAMTDVPVRRQA